MKMKFSLLLLCFLLVLPIFTDSSAQAAESKSATISIPVNTGLTGSGNSAKTFFLEMPSSVNSSMIKSGTLKYSGINALNGSIGIESGKIKVTLKGKESTEKISNVQGFKKDFGTPYDTTPGNSIWLYSDGRRWQINDYKAEMNTMDSYDLNASDGTVPSTNPPSRLITTQSLLGTTGLTWYNNSARATIDSTSIIQSTVKVLEFSNDLYNKTPNIKGVYFKNQRIIIDYMIPSVNGFRTNWTPEEDDGHHDLSGHAEGRRYQVTGYYYYLADANVTSYSYSGTITFDYTLPTEPTLDGSVIINQPNPNPAKYTGSDVPVSLTVKGDLAVYTNSSNIEEWIFYAKETGKDGTLKTKKSYSKTLSSSQSFTDFVIPKAVQVTDPYEQEYTVTVTVRFVKAIETSGGTITSLSKTMKATVGITKDPQPTNPPSGGNKPPVAVLDVPEEVMAGSEFLAYGLESYDPDGSIANYKFTAQGSQATISGPYGFTWYSLESLGRHTVILKVTDNGGLAATTSGKVEVIKPIPRAVINIGGTKKENRKVVITNKSTSPEHYPIDETKTQFTLAAVSGGTNADIKYSGPLSGINEKDVLFKKAGTYMATMTVTNTAGFSDSTSITFDIVPDEAPVVYLSVPSKVYRDPSDGNKAHVALSDMSFSPDYDFLAHRLWQYRYDSNNNNSFADESWVTLSDSNESQAIFKPNEVGRYEIRLTITEEFDQPTIAEFVTQSDRRQGNSDTQSAIEKIITVYNRAPVVDWSW